MAVRLLSIHFVSLPFLSLDRHHRPLLHALAQRQHSRLSMAPAQSRTSHIRNDLFLPYIGHTLAPAPLPLVQHVTDFVQLGQQIPSCYRQPEHEPFALQPFLHKYQQPLQVFVRPCGHFEHRLASDEQSSFIWR